MGVVRGGNVVRRGGLCFQNNQPYPQSGTSALWPFAGMLVEVRQDTLEYCMLLHNLQLLFTGLLSDPSNMLGLILKFQSYSATFQIPSPSSPCS